MPRTTCEVIAYGGWRNCVRLSDGQTEAIITTEVGPRIIRYGWVGGPNLFKEFKPQMGKRAGTKWRIYGGHRFWVAPEDKIRTYTPDNDPVAWSWTAGTLAIRQPVDKRTGLAKEIRISYAAHGALRLQHRLTNRNRTGVTCAPWALSVMAAGGTAIFPQEPYAPHPRALLPVRPLVLWAYTDLADPRWMWGTQEIRLRQDPRIRRPQKVGFLNRQGWMAYVLGESVFLKRHPFQPGAIYPDYGCNLETFTNADMLELESLGPLVTLRPGRTLDHVETWGLFRHSGPATLARLRSLVARVPPAH